jgi:Fe2+ or Zn2+ uptake regulation protein
MISKCANSACSAHFLYLHEGQVFRIMRDSMDVRELQLGVDPTLKKHPQVEFYWLCKACAGKMTIRYRKEGGVIVQPRQAALRAAS